VTGTQFAGFIQAERAGTPIILAARHGLPNEDLAWTKQISD
jgi:hypothetical protein